MENRKNRSRRNKIFIIISSVLVILVFLLFGIFIAKVSLFSGEDKKEESSSMPYRCFKYYPSTNESSIGITHLKTPLRNINGNFLSFQDNQGNYVLIYPFRSSQKEYKCEGSCYCDDDDQLIMKTSRRSSYALSNGLFYLVAAISSIYAIQIAKGYFQKHCFTEFQDTCASSQIQSIVDDCFLAISIDDDDDEEDEEDYEYYNFKGKVEDKGVFTGVDGKETGFYPYLEGQTQKVSVNRWKCSGFCYTQDVEQMIESKIDSGEIPTKYIDTYRAKYKELRKQADDMECEKKVFDAELAQSPDSPFYKEKNLPLQYFDTRKQFVERQLHPFCMFSSSTEFHFGNEWGQDMQSKFSVCTGFDTFGMNSDAKCVPIDPQFEFPQVK